MSDQKLTRVPHQTREALGWLLSALKRIERMSSSALQTPVTTQQRVADTMVAALEARIEQVGADGLLRDFLTPLARVKWAEFPARIDSELRKRRRGIASTTAGRDLLALFDEAEQRVRNSSFAAMRDPLEHGESLLVAASRLAGVRGTRGERRVILVRDALGEVSESLYKPFLEVLWKLEHLAKGRKPPSPPTYGRLVQDLKVRLATLPSLVDEDAAHFRNAIAHSRTRYDLRTTMLRMSDRNGWTKSLTAAELHTRTMRMFTVAGPLYQNVVNLMILTSQRPFVAFVPELLEVLLSGDHAAQAKISSQWAALSDEAWSEVRRLTAPR